MGDKQYRAIPVSEKSRDIRNKAQFLFIMVNVVLCFLSIFCFVFCFNYIALVKDLAKKERLGIRKWLKSNNCTKTKQVVKRW